MLIKTQEGDIHIVQNFDADIIITYCGEPYNTMQVSLVSQEEEIAAGVICEKCRNKYNKEI